MSHVCGRLFKMSEASWQIAEVTYLAGNGRRTQRPCCVLPVSSAVRTGSTREAGRGRACVVCLVPCRNPAVLRVRPHPRLRRARDRWLRRTAPPAARRSRYPLAGLFHFADVEVHAVPGVAGIYGKSRYGRCHGLHGAACTLALDGSGAQLRQFRASDMDPPRVIGDSLLAAPQA